MVLSHLMLMCAWFFLNDVEYLKFGVLDFILVIAFLENVELLKIQVMHKTDRYVGLVFPNKVDMYAGWSFRLYSSFSKFELLRTAYM